MRNLVSSILPPNRSLLIKVEPPLQANEQPTVLTVRKSGLLIEQLRNDVVRVSNNSNVVMPILFCVIDRRLPRWLGIAKQLLLPEG